MRYTPYPCQQAAIEDAHEFLLNAEPGAKRLYSGPTGVGKSIVELILQRRLDSCYIVTPREEIVDGMLDKLDAPSNAVGPDYGIWTPITLRNRLLDGVVPHPKYLIFDETHHHEASSWKDLDLLSGLCPAVGFTASPYRGSPRSTASFRETWGEPVPIITYPEAIASGYIKMPTMEILPLVDDDIVDVSGGEFSVTSLEAATVDRLADLAEHSRRWYSNRCWDLPTVYALPSGAMCTRMQQELGRRGMPAAIVSCRHPRAERPEVFEAVEAGLLALLHVNVVQEGVDLRLGRLVDAAPSVSPVKWVQQIGRIMRPHEWTPHYVCTNRNILRHAYILDGVVPVETVAQSDKLFGPTTRGHSRVLGMEAIGRFKPASVETIEGVKVHVYSLSVLVQNVVVEYCCLLHPTRQPIWAAKVNTVKDGVRTYGNWAPCEPPTTLQGFSSATPRELSDKQRNFWNRAARSRGLKLDQEVTRKNFQALPVLFDLGEYV